VEYYRFLSGPGVNEALAAGSIDAGVGGDMPTALALSSGMKITVLAAVGKSLRQAIVVGKKQEKEIQKVADLAGKKVAVAKGSTSHYFLYKTLAENGIDPAQVSILHLSVKAQPQALLSGEMAAAANWEPWPSRLEKEGIGRILVAGSFAGYLYARNDFILRNPEAALDLVRALQEARDYASSHREETCNWVGEETGEDPLLVCQAMKTDRIFQAGENVKPEPELIGELERLAKFALDYKLIEKLPDISAKFDLTFVEKVLNDQGRKTN
jgi:sulfonate transport system substrate-binding protein